MNTKELEGIIIIPILQKRLSITKLSKLAASKLWSWDSNKHM